VVYLSGAEERYAPRVSRWLEDELRSRPGSTALRMQLADLRNIQQNFEEAEALYREVVKRDPNHRTALNNLAWLLAFRKGKEEEALGYINKAIELVGPAAELRDTRGIVLYHMGNLPMALLDLEDAAASPTPSRCFHLALAHHKINNRAAAADMLRKAKSLGLTPDKLHGLEQPYYDKLVSELQTQ
jgi:cellulose synthase operon protein C